jgi:excisionase family DNA binding protein
VVKVGAIHEGYITVADAAKLSGKGIKMIARLCQSGRLPGAEKIGNTWLIPRASVESYSPGKRGPRTKKEKLSAELDGIKAAISETNRLEAE